MELGSGKKGNSKEEEIKLRNLDPFLGHNLMIDLLLQAEPKRAKASKSPTARPSSTSGPNPTTPFP